MTEFLDLETISMRCGVSKSAVYRFVERNNIISDRRIGKHGKKIFNFDHRFRPLWKELGRKPTEESHRKRTVRKCCGSCAFLSGTVCRRFLPSEGGLILEKTDFTKCVCADYRMKREQKNDRNPNQAEVR